jgi:hypothetical protein
VRYLLMARFGVSTFEIEIRADRTVVETALAR